MNDIIQGLWVGPELSVMEQLSVSSFLRHGHQYHLYVYEDVKNIPEGTTVKDGHEILRGFQTSKPTTSPPLLATGAGGQRG
jgi:hypothetical protein